MVNLGLGFPFPQIMENLSSLSPVPLPSVTTAPPPSPFDPDIDDRTWYGNIQYLINISAIGAFFCVLIFLFVKLRSDHRRMPGPSALIAKLLAVWHATGRQIAHHCGADSAQFLHIEGGSFALLSAISICAVACVLPLNLYGGSVSMDDQFAKTTINHISKGSPLLWFHFLLEILVVVFSHYGISKIEERFRDDNGNPRAISADSVAIFTVMIQGIPKTLASNKAPLEEYFQHKYPGKVYKVIVPLDLCCLDDMLNDLLKVRDEISWLEARIDFRILSEENVDEDVEIQSEGLRNQIILMLRRLKEMWSRILSHLGFTDEDRLRSLHDRRLDLENELLAYKEGQAPGAGIAFVIFKDVYTANKAVQDFRTEKRRPIGQFVSVMELQLGRSRWRFERAPLPSDIYWNHLCLSKFSLRLRRIAVNTCLLLMLLFCSSPLAVISAFKSAGRIINAEALDHAQMWLVWVGNSGWFASIIFQFLPNVLIFVSMYVVIPSVLSYLSKFERHLTVSGEQRAALFKMVCFFLVNLILLRALVESSLEGALLRMGRCYLDGEDCKRIEQYMSASFLSRSCLSSLAFLITSTFLGISYDLLSPIPWIKKKLQKFQKNDMLQLVPEQNEEYAIQNQDEDLMRRPLLSEREVSIGISNIEGSNSSQFNGIDLQGQDLTVYPINRSFHIPKQTFDFAQYYAFNLTIYALTLIYFSFAPLVVPVGAIYFGYRYIVDKYNFLFVYRIQGFPAGNDGKLMDGVLCIMRFCVVLYLLSMLLFFTVHGDSTKLQAIFTFVLLLLYKLLPPQKDELQPSILESIQTVDTVVVGTTDYENFSQPRLDWAMYNI